MGNLFKASFFIVLSGGLVSSFLLVNNAGGLPESFLAAKIYYQKEDKSENFENIFVLPDKAKRTATLLSFGDLMLGRAVGRAIGEGKDIFGLFDERALKGYDAVSANLEGPITDFSKCQKKIYSFRFASSSPEIIFNAGIGMVNLANNHIFDCYEKGLDDTKRALSNGNVDYFGNEKGELGILRKKIGDFEFSFFGIDLTIDPVLDEKIFGLIFMEKEMSRKVVVNVHWGHEYEKKYSKSQKTIGQKLIDAGADAVIGHHPHVVQPLEIYSGRPIFYSLGNFVFDQIGEEENQGIGAGLVFEEDSLVSIVILPFSIKDKRPEFLEQEKASDYCGGFLRDFAELIDSPCVLRLDK